METRNLSSRRVGGHILLALGLLALVLPQFPIRGEPSPLPATPTPPPEFTLPIPDDEGEEWQVFTGVGHTLHIPPGWEVHTHRTQGGIRDSATFDFFWADERGLVARVEALEIVAPHVGATAMQAEMSFWQQYGEELGCLVEAVMVQGHPGWWVQTVASAEMVETLWVDWGERVYRFRLHHQAGVQGESERQLRQMLSTLAVVPLDWSRMLVFSSALPVETAAVGDTTAPDALAGVPYNRGVAYAYAYAYWDQLTNDDGCYLWYNGSTLDCTYHAGDWGVDGAHFANRVVHAGGRPIPGLWDGAALRVADLRDWLVGDDWITVTPEQAEVGDVVIMGPFDTPCWVGLVVSTGSNPTLATHSDELWAPANTLYCYHNSQPTYEKTYLHAEVEFTAYLPVALRNYRPPPSPKQWSGIHMGNRIYADWSSDMLAPFDPEAGGTWPQIVVAQSNQVFTITRPAPDCRVTGIEVRNLALFNYLRDAAQAGVRVVIRITPSPGNFEESVLNDWPDLPGRTLITEPGVHPGGWPQCDNDWRFRPVDDVGDEMLAIQRFVLWYAPPGYEWQVFGFEPANEPNTEWYGFDTQPGLDDVGSWQDMDQYFANLYDYVHENAGYLPIRVLTPPMAQTAYAEMRDIRSGLPGCEPFAFSGYEQMALTFNSTSPKNDGYTWHNYWIQGREAWAGCPNGQHVSMWFPDTMEGNIQNNVRPAVVTEADLASPQQNMGNPLMDKDTQPQTAAASIRDFLYHEQAHMAEDIAIWLLNDDTGTVEHMWHQAYFPSVGFRPWFTYWWYNSENP